MKEQKQQFKFTKYFFLSFILTNGCGICQQYKINRSLSHPSYMLISTSSTTQPFAHCSMDLITDLPLSHSFNSILVMVDHGLTKGVVILLPCNSCQTIIRKSLQTIQIAR